eukprot:scaffold38330_cov44-Prasinocladus_malaysianus.AAC.1
MDSWRKLLVRTYTHNDPSVRSPQSKESKIKGIRRCPLRCRGTVHSLMNADGREVLLLTSIRPARTRDPVA